jgi:hypothetical protein
MIVHQHECGCSFAYRDSKRIPGAHVDPVNAAGSDASNSPQAVASVECEQPELFVIERRETWASPFLDRPPIRHALERLDRCREGGAPPELNGGSKASRLRDADPCPLGQLSQAGTCQPGDAPVFFQQHRCKQANGQPGTARSDDDGHELGVAEVLDAHDCCAFARSDWRVGEGHAHAPSRSRSVPSDLRRVNRIGSAVQDMSGSSYDAV